jgi:DNA-binding response OmpR family regulator
MRILSIEDNKEYQVLIYSSLKDKYTIDFSENLYDFDTKIKSTAYGCVLIDLFLPDGSGFEAYNIAIKHFGQNEIPIIFLSSDNNPKNIIEVLNLGADDFIFKSINSDELSARIHSNINKFYKRNNILTQYFNENIEIDLANSKIYITDENKKQNIGLTPIEFKIFLCLFKKMGIIQSREEIIRNIWGENYFIHNRIVDKHISSLRNKLSPYMQNIRTISGYGYKYEEKVTTNKKSSNEN